MDNPEKSYRNDPVLIRFLQSIEDEPAEGALSDLLTRFIQPTIEKNLRAKMRVSLKSDDFCQANQDALEIAGEAKLLILAELNKLKADQYGRAVCNLSSYTASVTLNAYRQYLRKKYPLRQQLKNRLRYLLTHHHEFMLREEANGLICALKAYSANPIGTIKSEILTEIKKFNLHRPNQIIELVRKIFETIKSPIFFDELLATVAEIQGVKDKPDASHNELFALQDVNGVGENKLTDAVEQKELLEKIWLEIGALPVRHRQALLLNLRDRRGESVIPLLPLLRIATIRQIAGVLSFSAEDFAAVWRELPWEDAQIAEFLGLRRQQVINLRQSARLQLSRRCNFL